MARRTVDVAVIIPDASPVLTLVRVGRLDLLGSFTVPELWTMSEDLTGNSLADVLEKLEKGKIGHRAAMEWLAIDSFDDLVEIMHMNGRLMPGHQPMRVAPETRELIRQIFRRHPESV